MSAVSKCRKLLADIGPLCEGARQAVTEAYWKVGQHLVEVEQDGEASAELRYVASQPSLVSAPWILWRVRNMLWLCLLAAQLLVSVPADAGQGGGLLQEFEVRDYLGHDWRNELVTFACDRPAARLTPQVAVCLVGPNGAIVPHQFVETGAGKNVAFLADLPASGTVTYRLVAGRDAHAESSLRVTDVDNQIRMENALFGVDIRKALHGAEGPIAGIRMRSGLWGGDSSLRTERKVLSYSATVTAAGPVYGEVRVAVAFEGGATWTLRIRVIEGEPVAVVDETCSLSDGSCWELGLSKGLDVNHGIFRCAWYRPDYWPTHALFARPLFGGKRDSFVLLPWIGWSDGHQVSCVSLYHEDEGATFAHDKTDRRILRQFSENGERAPDGRDVLFAAAGRAGEWVRPGKRRKCGVPLKTDDGAAVFRFSLAGPVRHWLIGATTFDKTLVPDKDLMEAEVFAIKHCGTSLEEVRNMTLVWGGDDAMTHYPRIGFGGKEKEALSKTAGRKKAERAVKQVQPARLFLQNVQHWDAKAGQHTRRHDYKVWTHTICRSGFVPAVDEAMGGGFLTAEEFVRLRARLAFMAYKFGSPDFYSHERGWRANPNMTTMRHSLVGLLGCLLGDHPKASEWYDVGAREIRRQLDQWVGPNGGWLESPHYQSLLGDGVMLLCAARNNGLSQDIFNENLLKTIVYLAKISTPPDPRFGNLRHLPPVGNTYRFETSGFFGILSNLHRTRHPETAGALQWMWLQQGKPMWTGIGGGSYISVVMSSLVDPVWTNVCAPTWGSEVFPNSGTVLRAHLPGSRETRMYVLHGKFAQHYDKDRGSFSLWGKGQPLCLDWGYVTPYTSDMHNMLTSGQGVGAVTAFHTSEAADYLHVDRGPWQRQVLFVKDACPEGPNFFVVRDTSGSAGRRHQWFYTERPLAVAGNVVRMVGQADVDLDVWLAGQRIAELPRMTRQEASAARPPTERAPSGASDAALLKTRDLSTSCPTGTGNGSNKMGDLFQRGLTLSVGIDKPVMALYYPRLKSESSPTFKELADGKGVVVTSTVGTDYAFLAVEPFTYQGRKVSFSGTAGTIRVRGKTVVLTLGARGTITYGAKRLESKTATSGSFEIRQ